MDFNALIRADAVRRRREDRAIIEKKEWFEVYENHGHISMMLCRFDRTGMISTVYSNSTRTQLWKHGWLDEIRDAFQELAGMLENDNNFQKSRPKKAM